MLRKLKFAAACIAAAGLAVSVMGQVEMQTTQDSIIETANGPRLVINGKPIFISGINIAWRDFAKDVGTYNGNDAITSPQLGQFKNWFEQISVAGGNAVRWWLHTDAQHSPLMDMSTGAVTGLSDATIPNMRAVLDLAYEYGIVVSMCLFSFDLLQNDNNKTEDQMARNYKFLTEPGNLDTYIENALRPVLDSIGNHPAIMCWEVFNEPEGMSEEHGWATQKIPHSDIMRFTGRIAAEVRSRTNKMASTGIHNFHSYVNRYTKDKLIEAAGGDTAGYLDFYMAHHYPEWESMSQSPFTRTADSWNFDKPVLIGEFPARGWGPGTNYAFGSAAPVGTVGAGGRPNGEGFTVTIEEAYEWAYENGYLGAMSWSITEGNPDKFGNLATTVPALTNLASKYDDIRIRDDIEIIVPQGDLAMKIVFDAQPVGDANEVLFKKTTTFDLATATNLTFDMYIDAASGSNVQMDAVIQGTDWSWNDVSVNLNGIEKDAWNTVTIPISQFGASSVYAIFFKFVATGTPFSGTIYIDNVKIDDTVISDFNDLYTEWGVEKGDAAVSLAPRPDGSTSIRHTGRDLAGINRMPSVLIRGNMLNVRGVESGAEMSVRLVNMRGRTVANFKAVGSAQFPLQKIPAGRYIVETKVAGRKIGTTAAVIVK